MTPLQQCKYIQLNARGYKHGAKKFAASILQRLEKGVLLSPKQLQVLNEIYCEVVSEESEIDLEWEDRHDISILAEIYPD